MAQARHEGPSPILDIPGYGIPTVIESYLSVKVTSRQGSQIIPKLENAPPPKTVKGVLIPLPQQYGSMHRGWDARNVLQNL